MLGRGDFLVDHLEEGLHRTAAFAGEPEVVSNLTIVVEDSRYEEIYVEPTKMVCDVECPAKSWIENAVFMEAARKHKSWLKKGEVGAVYNKDTIELTHNDCDWNRNPWILFSTVFNNYRGTQCVLG